MFEEFDICPNKRHISLTLKSEFITFADLISTFHCTAITSAQLENVNISHLIRINR